MELDGAFGEIQFTSDFFIGQTTKNSIEDLFLAACEPDAGFYAVAGVKEFLGPGVEVLKIFRGGGNHDEVIAGGLATHHAMHGEQTCGMINRKFPIGSRVDAEMRCSGGLLTKQVNTGRVRGLGSRNRLVRKASADELHVHSSVGASWWERDAPDSLD